MDNVNKTLKTEWIETTNGLGIYYDNPDTTPVDKLRSDVGMIIDTKDISKLDRKSADYKIKTIPASDSALTQFPIKNSLSYVIWPMKAYPALTRYLTDKWYKTEVEAMELYDMTAMKIYYIINIKK